MESNSSGNIFTREEIELIVARGQVLGPINAAFMLLFFLVGVPWNLLVIGVIVKKKLYTDRPSVMLMLNLTIVNLLVCLLVMPFTIFFGVSVDYKNAIAMGDFFLANEVCQSGVLLILLLGVSSMTATFTNSNLWPE